MSINRVLITAPTDEPLELDDVRRELRIVVDDDDAEVFAYIVAARQWLESMYDLALLTQTWDLLLDKFPKHDGPILVPWAPLASVTSIKYIDDAGAEQTVDAADYLVSASDIPPRIALADAASWPTNLRLWQPGIVRVVLGWATPDDVPRPIRQALLLHIKWQYARHEPTPQEWRAYDHLLAPYAPLVSG